MKKLLGLLVLGLILFAESASAKQTKWVTGKIYQDEVTWLKNVKIKLPPGEFKLVDRYQWSSWGINIKSTWLMNLKGNLFHQDVEFNKIGGVKYLAYLKIIYEEIFFKNKYDGCYPRSEYTVLKRRKKGGFFNCFKVRHVDVQKYLYYPDDPKNFNTQAKHIIKKHNIDVPSIVLCSKTDFYAPSITETVMEIIWCINPETNGASKTQFTTEESSEYHPQNINKFPDKKKFMEDWIKLSVQRHKSFEKEIKAKEKHKIDFGEYDVSEIIEETKTTISSSSITDQLNKLNNLYKEGAITKEEFEKAKKKTLSQ